MSGLNRGSLTGLLMAAALGATASMGGMPYAIQPTGVQVTATKRKSTSSAGRYVGEWGYPTGPGWSNRHVKRMATKRKNQQRHKKATRG